MPDLSCGHLDVEGPEVFVVHLKAFSKMAGKRSVSLFLFGLVLFLNVRTIVYVRIYTCIYCIYIYTYMFIYIYIYYTQTYTHTYRSTQNEPTLSKTRNRRPEAKFEIFPPVPSTIYHHDPWSIGALSCQGQ